MFMLTALFIAVCNLSIDCKVSKTEILLQFCDALYIIVYNTDRNWKFPRLPDLAAGQGP